MRNLPAWLGSALFSAGLLIAAADASLAQGLVFLSTQLRPIEKAEKMRKVILKDFPHEVDYVTELPPQRSSPCNAPTTSIAATRVAGWEWPGPAAAVLARGRGDRSGSVDDLAYLYLDLAAELKLDNAVLVGPVSGVGSRRR